MPRRRVKIARIESKKSKARDLKKIWLRLQKMVRELTILCDVQACVTIFGPDEAEPMVWPSIEVARNLFHDYFALSDSVKKKYETTFESYLEEKTRAMHDQLMNLRKKNKESAVGQLMMQLQKGRRIDDLNMSEIFDMLSFSREQIMLIRKELKFEEYPPLREPPMDLIFEARSEEFRTATNDVSMVGDQDDAGFEGINRADKRTYIDYASENRSHYLMDQWFPTSPEPSNFKIHQQIKTEMASFNGNANSISRK